MSPHTALLKLADVLRIIQSAKYAKEEDGDISAWNAACEHIEEGLRQAASHGREGGEAVAWRYRFVTSVDGKEWSDWFIVDDPKSIPSREGQTVQPLYATVAQVSGTCPAMDPVAWEYELATVKSSTGEYGGWELRLRYEKPNVPEGSVRNLTPLYCECPQREASAFTQASREWISPIKTVADLVNNLQTLDQAMDVYGAYFIDQTEDRCRARGLSLSREHVANGRIKRDEAIPFSLVIWSALDKREAASSAPSASCPAQEWQVPEIKQALILLLAAAKLMPRATPAPGAPCTVHNFPIEAAYVWGLDRACKAAEKALSVPSAQGNSPKERGNRFCKHDDCPYPDCLVEGVCPSQPAEDVAK